MKMFVCAMFVALTLSPSPNAQASIARAISFEQKIDDAEMIVLGRCVERHSAYDPSGRWILTYTTFEVEKSYKGVPGTRITIVTPGGVVGSRHQETLGVPRFGEGDVNILFLKRSGAGPTVLFFDQGVYRVVSDEASGERVVAPVRSDLVLIDTQTGRVKSASDEGAQSLSAFERQLRERLERERSSR